nr:immunoglobulin heavy chain junction region [Mus musculus]
CAFYYGCSYAMDYW